MKLADALGVSPEPVKKPSCRIAEIRKSLDDHDSAALTEALVKIVDGDGPWTVAWLHRTLVASGYKVSRDSLNRHTKRVCSCDTL